MTDPTVKDVLTLLADWLEADFEYGNNLYPDREDELSRRYEAADAAVRELDVDHLRTLAEAHTAALAENVRLRAALWAVGEAHERGELTSTDLQSFMVMMNARAALNPGEPS